MIDHEREHKYYTLPRLYIDEVLKAQGSADLTQGQAHYLKNVMRKAAGDEVRVFNGRDGEWLCRIEVIGKKSGTLEVQALLREQTRLSRRVHVMFSPLKKTPMDFLMQKAVELGVTDFHPVLANRTTTRHINSDRLRAQIVEATEQCERMDIPRLHDLQPFSKTLLSWPEDITTYAAIERYDAKRLTQEMLNKNTDIAFLIGPEGGFPDDEAQRITAHKAVQAVDLGPHLLRAETAVLACLALVP